MGALQPGLLGPGDAIADEYVSRPGVGLTVIRLIPVYPRGVAVLAPGADDGGIAGDGDGTPENIPGFSIGGFQIGLLTPCGYVSGENVGGARVGCTVALVPVDARSRAVLPLCSHDNSVAGN